jgi:hypothetical protein
MALIEIAHPKFRAELFVKAQRMGYVPAEQTLKNMRAYPVEEETVIRITKGPRRAKRCCCGLRPAMTMRRHPRSLPPPE